MGESFSGPLALMVAARRPAALRGVVLCASFIRSPLPWFPSALEMLVGRTTFALAPGFVRSSLLLGRHASPRLRSLLHRAHGLVDPGVMAARARAILHVDVSSALRDCSAPLLYLRSGQDRMVSENSWRLVAELRPDARVEVLPGPHLLLQTHPAEAIAAIERFLASSVSDGAETCSWTIGHLR